MWHSSTFDELVMIDHISEDDIDNDHLMLIIDNYANAVGSSTAYTTHERMYKSFSETKPIHDKALQMAKKYIQTYVQNDRRALGFNNCNEFYMTEMWGFKVVGDNHDARTHTHWPHLLTFVYYLEATDPLVFNDMNNYSVTPERGMIVMFPGYTKHTAKTADIRYGFAGSVDVIIPDRTVEDDKNDRYFQTKYAETFNPNSWLYVDGVQGKKK